MNEYINRTIGSPWRIWGGHIIYNILETITLHIRSPDMYDYSELLVKVTANKKGASLGLIGSYNVFIYTYIYILEMSG